MAERTERRVQTFLGLIGAVASALVAGVIYWPLPSATGAAGIAPPAIEDREAQRGPMASPYDRSLARPLFDPLRRPIRAAETGGPARPMAGPRLLGMIGEGGRRSALLKGETAAEGMLARKGDMVEGWHVTAVTGEGVLLERNGETRRLALWPASREDSNQDPP